MKKQKKPIELYYWPTPNGWKISIMLEECKIPYVLKPVNIGKGDQFKPKFLKISPNNRMPIFNFERQNVCCSLCNNVSPRTEAYRTASMM